MSRPDYIELIDILAWPTVAAMAIFKLSPQLNNISNIIDEVRYKDVLIKLNKDQAQLNKVAAYATRNHDLNDEPIAPEGAANHYANQIRSILQNSGSPRDKCESIIAQYRSIRSDLWEAHLSMRRAMRDPELQDINKELFDAIEEMSSITEGLHDTIAGMMLRMESFYDHAITTYIVLRPFLARLLLKKTKRITLQLSHQVDKALHSVDRLIKLADEHRGSHD